MTRKIRGGPNMPAKAITSADLVQNGGEYALATKTAIAVSAADSPDRGIAPVKARAYLPITEAEIASGEYSLLAGVAEPIYEVSAGYENDGLLAYPVYVNSGSFGSSEQPQEEYDEDAVVYWGEYADSLTTERKQLDSDLFADLKADGLFDLFEYIHIYAHENENVALRNLVERDHDCAKFNSPTWAANEGYTFNGSSSYLSTDFVPSTDASVSALGNTSIGVYSRTDLAAAAAYDTGAVGGGHETWVQCKGSTRMTAVVNSNVSNISPVATSLGLHHVVKPAATQAIFYQNGAEIMNDPAVSSTGLPTTAVFTGCRNVNGSPAGYTTRQIAVDFYSGSMSGALATLLYTRIEAYLDAIGAGVVA